MTRTKNRESNIELLRIVAMLLVIIVHTNFFTINEPTNSELTSEPIKSATRFFIQSLSIICVNVFVLISGWFGIRPKRRRFLEFLFQIVFILGILYVIFYFINPEKWPLWDSVKATLMIDHRCYWFVKSYVFLYLLSPVLNAFTDNANPKQFLWTVIGFFAIEFIYGWLFQSISFFDRGYSTISFIGLYLLARYINLHGELLKRIPLIADIAIWLIFTLLTTAFGMISNYHTWVYNIRFYFYDSPFVVGASLFFFLSFQKIKFRSRLVNWIGASAFAAYLLHCNVAFMSEIFTPVLKTSYATSPYPMYLLEALVFAFAIFTISIFLDKARITVWNLLVKGYEKINKK